MNERHCHRCETTLHIESEGALVYCFNCGAPQIFLSEELQEQAAERLRLEQHNLELEAPFTRAQHSSNDIDWKLAIKLGMAVSGVLAALSVILPPLGLLVFAWAPVAPAVVISLYGIRTKRIRFSAGTGARIGIVCGSFIVLALALLNAILLDVMRFVFHRTDFDTGINALLAQVRSQSVAQSGQQAADVFNMLNVPEFRAGFFIAGFGTLALLVLLLAAGGGAIAGGLQKRRRVS